MTDKETLTVGTSVLVSFCSDTIQVRREGIVTAVGTEGSVRVRFPSKLRLFRKLGICYREDWFNESEDGRQTIEVVSEI